MTRIGRLILVTVAGALALGGTGLRAQLDAPITFTTTFDFTVGNTTFPMGAYEIRPVSDESGVIQVVSRTGSHAAYVEVTGGEPQKSAKSEVIFQRYGDKYLLKGVWDASTSSGFTTTVTHAEKVHAKSGTPTEQRLAAASKPKS